MATRRFSRSTDDDSTSAMKTREKAAGRRDTDSKNVRGSRPRNVSVVRAVKNKNDPVGKTGESIPDAERKDVPREKNLVTPGPDPKLSLLNSEALTADRLIDIFCEKIVKTATMRGREIEDHPKEEESEIVKGEPQGEKKSKIPVRMKNFTLTSHVSPPKDRRTGEDIKESLSEDASADESCKMLTVNDNRANERARENLARATSATTQCRKNVFGDYTNAGKVKGFGRYRSRMTYRKKAQDYAGRAWHGGFFAERRVVLQDISLNNQDKRTFGRPQTSKNNEIPQMKNKDLGFFLCDTCKTDCHVTGGLRGKKKAAKDNVKVTSGMPKEGSKFKEVKEESPRGSFLERDMNEDYIIDDEDHIPINDEPVVAARRPESLFSRDSVGAKPFLSDDVFKIYPKQKAENVHPGIMCPIRLPNTRPKPKKPERNSIFLYRANLAKSRENMSSEDGGQKKLPTIELRPRKTSPQLSGEKGGGVSDKPRLPSVTVTGQSKPQPSRLAPARSSIDESNKHNTRRLSTAPISKSQQSLPASSIGEYFKQHSSRLSIIPTSKVIFHELQGEKSSIDQPVTFPKYLLLKPVTRNKHQHQDTLQRFHRLRLTTPTSHVRSTHMEGLKEMQKSDTHKAFTTIRLASFRSSPAVIRWPQKPKNGCYDLKDDEVNRDAWWQNARPFFRIDQQYIGTPRFDPLTGLDSRRCYFLYTTGIKHHLSPYQASHYFKPKPPPQPKKSLNKKSITGPFSASKRRNQHALSQ